MQVALATRSPSVLAVTSGEFANSRTGHRGVVPNTHTGVCVLGRTPGERVLVYGPGSSRRTRDSERYLPTTWLRQLALLNSSETEALLSTLTVNDLGDILGE